VSPRCLAAVGVSEHADRSVGGPSAGLRERVALARAAVDATAVLLADDPTVRLDAATTLTVGGLLAELDHTTGTTVVCATHDPLLVDLADRERRLGEPAGVAST